MALQVNVAASTKERLEDVPLETGLELTGFGKYNIYILLISSMSLLATTVDVLSLVFVVTACSCDLELTLQQKGFLTTVPLLGVLVMCYPWGYISDTKGRHKSLLVSMSLAFVFSVATSFSTSITTITLFKFLSSASGSAGNSLSYSFLGEYTPEKYRDKMVYYTTSSVFLATTFLATVAIPTLVLADFKYPLGVLDIVFTPWRLHLIVLAVPYAIAALLLLYCSETPKFLLIQGKTDEAMRVLRKIYAVNFGTKENEYPVASLSQNDEKILSANDSFLKSLWTQFVPLFKKPLLKYTFMLCSLQIGVFFVFNVFYFWFPQISLMFTSNRQGSTDDSFNLCAVLTNALKNSTNKEKEDNQPCNQPIQIEIPLILISVSLTCTISNLLMIEVSRCVNKKYLLVVLLVFLSIACILINLIHITWVGFSMYVLLMLVPISVGLIASFLVQMYPTPLRGMAMCIATMAARLGGIAGTNLFGYAVETHCEELYYLLAVILISSAAVSYFLPEYSARKIENNT